MTIGFSKQIEQLFVVERRIEVDADPAPRADVRWAVETVGIAFDEHLLDSRRSRAPNPKPHTMVVGAKERKALFAVDKPGWLSVADFFSRHRKGHGCLSSLG